MPLVYSYETELKRLEFEKKALLLSLEQHPNNERLLNLLKDKDRQIEWTEQRIREGKGLPARIL